MATFSLYDLFECCKFIVVKLHELLQQINHIPGPILSEINIRFCFANAFALCIITRYI